MPNALKVMDADFGRRVHSLPSVEIVASIRQIERDAWDGCFPGEVENWDYLAAVEEAGIDGFEFLYVTVRDAGRLVAAMPAFMCSYGLETTLDEPKIRKSVMAIRRVIPRFLMMRLACLGSPCTEVGRIGLHPSATGRAKELFGVLLDGFQAHAAKRNCSLIALKDIQLPAAPFDEPIAARGFVALDGMPTAWMDVRFKSLDDYLSSLSSGTRKDMRRKLRSKQDVRIEYCTDYNGLLPRIIELYRSTRERSDWQFEELTPAYFEGVLHGMSGRSLCIMYYVQDELLAANLVLCDQGQLIDKFFCMDGELGREFNLYYLSWFTNVNYCIQHGLHRYQSGQAYYQNKVRLGSSLTKNAMFFRHRNPVLQWVLKTISPLFAIKEGEDRANEAS
ncbi:GNAT family N-acetyltransferase [Oryzifoliimicrobium ureilyticus]|uniref:GNAT family N-acetyltransferase n=1 Tax=Oryzifoliimicrobium ureilyticus TaxID=3113724 RepID=UPI00307678E8